VKPLRHLIQQALGYRPWVARGSWHLYGWALDRLYSGESLGNVIPTRFADQGAHAVHSTAYRSLAAFLKGRLEEDDVFVDVGCGQGRPFIWLLHKGFRNPMIGLELDSEIAQQTSRRFERYPNITIIPGDAIENLPECGTLFYVANPFDRDVVQRLKRRLETIPRGGGFRVIYYNGVHVDVFSDDQTWSVVDVDSGVRGYPAYLLRME
jgi:SAM-dependent methyltransferase